MTRALSPRHVHIEPGGHHLHLVCRICGQIIETDVSVADNLVADLAQQHGFVTDVTHFAIFGRCKDCVS